MEYDGMKALRRGSFTVTDAVFDASFADFTTTAGVANFNYYGDWWSDNLGTTAAVADTYCDAGEAGENGGTATSTTYPGVSWTSDRVAGGLLRTSTRPTLDLLLPLRASV